MASEPDANFEWKKLEGHTLLADHGAQPLAMLKHAVKDNGVDWTKIIASVGTSMPNGAFSNLCCSREHQKSEG